MCCNEESSQLLPIAVACSIRQHERDSHPPRRPPRRVRLLPRRDLGADNIPSGARRPRPDRRLHEYSRASLGGHRLLPACGSDISSASPSKAVDVPILLLMLSEPSSPPAASRSASSTGPLAHSLAASPHATSRRSTLRTIPSRRPPSARSPSATPPRSSPSRSSRHLTSTFRSPPSSSTPRLLSLPPCLCSA